MFCAASQAQGSQPHPSSAESTGTIAGCRIIDGVARRGTIVRLSRGGKVIWTGKLASLRREAEDAKEVKTGFECGMTLDGFQDLREEDNLEFVQTTLIKRKLGD